MTVVAQQGQQPRRRGRPPRISREQIVAVARTMDPETITMQAVADQLGVDRKAVNYHVRDRNTLLHLVASDLVASEMEHFELPETDDWRDLLRYFTKVMRDVTVKAGPLAPYSQLTLASELSVFGMSDRVMAILLEAGFELEDVGRLMGLLAHVATGSARDVWLTRDGRIHPQFPEIARVLEEAPAEDYPTMRRLFEEMGEQPDPHEQLEFALDLMIAGAEQLLRGEAD